LVKPQNVGRGQIVAHVMPRKIKPQKVSSAPPALV
jgi:hypothetical protein